MEHTGWMDDYRIKPSTDVSLDLPRNELEEEKPEKWSSVCLHFTQNTTFHGINKITEHTPFPIRRVIWVLILLGGVSLFIFQMVGSVLQYLEYPVNVNTRIIYNKTITFPAVTVCNQNVFRISQAADHGYYHLIDDIYRHDSLKKLNLSDQWLSATNTTLKHLYDDAAHNKQDMIVRCLWDQELCSPDDFVTTITDHGVCFTFNSGKKGPVKMASQTGSEGGLQLKLNIEQYEYMRGPNRAAGAKILVHDQAEIPFVRDFGQSISPGSHAFVGIQMTEINNLRKPHGECSARAEANLQFFTDYNIPNCQVDCMASYLMEKCNCRLVHMPQLPNSPGEPPYCSLGQMQQCVEPKLELFKLGQRSDSSVKKCNCSVPCTRHKYDTTISYAGISNFDMENQDREDNKAIKRRLTNALEITQRVDTHIKASDHQMVEDLEEAASSISLIFEQLSDKLHNITVFLDDAYYEMSNRTHFHRIYGLKVVQKALQYGFTQFWEIDQQQVIIPLTSGTKQMLKRYRKAMPLLVNASRSPLAFRQTVAWYQEELLSIKLLMAQRVRRVLKKVTKSIISGKPLLSYKWAITPRYNMVTVPRAILSSKVVYMAILSTYLEDQLNSTTQSLTQLRHMVRQAFHRHTWNETYFKELSAAFRNGILQLSYGHNIFKKGIFGKMEMAIIEKIAYINKLENAIKLKLVNLHITVKNFKRLVVTMKEDVWPSIMNSIQLSQRYKENNTMDKSTLASIVASAEIYSHLQQMADVFIDFRARARNLDYDWRKFRDIQIEAWRAIRNEETTRDFYEKLHQDFQTIFRAPGSNQSRELLEPLRETLELSPSAYPFTIYQRTNADIIKQDEARHVASTRLKFKTFLEGLSILSGVSEKEGYFFKFFQRWRQSLKKFIGESSIDDNFLKENFLEIDVYMTELYYQLVEQQVAYDLTNLWSDIGGSMGLFVGASVITVFELIDAILHNLLKVHLQKTKERQP